MVRDAAARELQYAMVFIIVIGIRPSPAFLIGK
jgi:hypothetical protein